jgi:O-acetylhomoserine/O-acetylserine sulfhydrylase
MTAITMPQVLDSYDENNTLQKNNNTTINLIEKQIACFESGSAALAYRSFRSARFSLIKNIKKNKNVIVLSFEPYISWAEDINALERIGVKVKFIDYYELDELKEKLLLQKIDIIYLGTIHTQKITIQDFNYIIHTAHINNVDVIFDNSFGALGSIYAPISNGADYVITKVSETVTFKNTLIGAFVVKGYSLAESRLNIFEEYWIEKIKHKRGITFKNKVLINIKKDRIVTILEEERRRQLEYSKVALTISKWLSRHESIMEVVYPGIEKNEFYLLADKYLDKDFGAKLKFSLWDNEYSYAIVRGYFLTALFSGLKITVDKETKEFYIEVHTTDSISVLRYLQKVFSNLYTNISFRNTLLKKKEEKMNVQKYVQYSLTHYISKRKY